MDRDRSAVAAAQLPLRRNSGSGSGMPPIPRSSSGRARPPPQAQPSPQHWLGHASRDGSVPNGVLLGSLAEYLPTSAVAYANAAAAGSGGGAAPLSSSPALSGGSSSQHVRRSAPAPLEAQSLSVLHGSQIIPEHTSPRVRPNGERAMNGAPPRAPSPKQREPQKGKPPPPPHHHHHSLQDAVLTRTGSNDVAGSQDLRSSKQSITVLSVTRDGRAQEWPRPPSSTSTAQARGEGTPAPVVRSAPAQPPRHASLNKVSSASSTPRGSVTGRVQVETFAPINETSLSTASTVHPGMPAPIAAAELRQRTTQQQQQQASSAPVPRPPRHNSVVSDGSTVYVQQPPPPQPQSRASRSASAHAAQYPARGPTGKPARSPDSVPHAAQPSGSAASNASSHTPRENRAETGALVPRAQPDVHHHHQQQRQPPQPQPQHGAVLHHRPAYTVAGARQAGEPLSAGPATMQVSTTTLTKTTKKVRYLLPDEPFDPDAPDPSDVNGLTAAEEAALLDPVQYTRAADDVAGRYPMLLRRASAQGGDLLRPRRHSGSSASGVTDPDTPRPTFLLDDGNRWARETNRLAVATTRDPAGMAATQLPSPSILRKGGAGTRAAGEAAPEAFPAYQRVSANGSSSGSGSGSGSGAGVEDAHGYLLQRHVQQVATGKPLVQGTTFQPPPTGQRHLARRRREQDEARLDAQLAAAAGHTNGAVSAGLPPTAPPRRGTLEGLYDEIVRRTQQNRRAALPTTSPGAAAAAPPPALPLPPASGERHRVRPHPSSAEPTPLHRGAGRAGRGAPYPPAGYPTSYLHAVAAPPQQQPPQPQPPARSSSQPYIPITYHYDETPSGSELGSRDGYRTPLVYAGAPPQAPPPTQPQPPQQQQQYYTQQHYTQQDSRAAPAVPRSHPTAYDPAQHSGPASTTASSARAASGQRPTGATAPRQESPPPRQQVQPQQQQQQPPPPAVSGPSGNGSARMPGYTSGRFSKYNAAVPPTAPAPDTDGHVASVGGSWSAQPPPPPPRQHVAPAYTSAPKPRPPPQREEPAQAYDHAGRPQQPSYEEDAEMDDYSDHRYAGDGETTHAQQQQQRQQRLQDETDEYAGSPYPAEDSLSDEPVTDAAGERTPRPPPQQQQQRPAAPAHDGSSRDGEEDDASASGGRRGAGAAVAEVRRSLLDQYNRATYVPAPPETVTPPAPSPPQLRTEELPAEALNRPHRAARSHHSHRSTATSSAASTSTSLSPPHPPAAAAPSTASARGSSASASTRPGESAGAAARGPGASVPSRAKAPPPPPPPAHADTSTATPTPTHTAATATTTGRDASVASSGSASSCDTDTQPIAVSEFDEDELAEAEQDELTKKGPPLLVLGDEVYAPEGFDYAQQTVEVDEYGAYADGDGAAAAAAGALAPEEEEEEQEYWAGEQAAASAGHGSHHEQPQEGFYHEDEYDEELPVPGEAYREL